MLKLKMMLCVMMLPLVVVGCTSKQSVSQCVKPPPPPAWIMQPPPDWRRFLTERDYFTLRRLITMQNNWKEPRSILMSSADRVAHIDRQLMQLLWAIHTLPTEYKCPKVIKPKPIHLRMFAGFSFFYNNTFSAPPQILAASTVSFCPIQKRRNDGWWFPLQIATAAGLFWTVNVCWAHPVISRASAVAWVAFFLWCYSRCFLKFAESYV